MANPSETADSDGEYVELYNRRSYAIDIDGFTLKDDGSNSHVIDNNGSLTIPAESFIVLARSGSPGFSPNYVYDGFTLANSGDQIVLLNENGVEIARLNYSSSEEGKSSELNNIKNIDANGEASASDYLTAVSQFSNDYGTPNAQGQTSLAEDPTVRILQSRFTASESSSSGTITIIIEDPDEDAVDVDLVFDETNSAAEPEDFSSSSPITVTFPSDASDGDTQTVYQLNDDNDFEGDEHAVFHLSNLQTDGNATIANATTTTLIIQDDDKPDVVINEINADPDSDASGNDGNASSDDEFVELLNNESVAVDISNWTISDETGIKYTFDAGTILKANSAAVVFANTNFSGTFGGSIVQGTSSLGLNNSGDSVILKDNNDLEIDSHSYGSEGGDNSSLVRDPEGTGEFVKHTTISSEAASPGTKTDGTNFTNTLTINGDEGWRMLSAPVDGMKISDLEDDIHIQGVGDSGEDNIFVSYDGSDFVRPSSISDELTPGKGFIVYLYNSDEYSSNNLPVTIDPGSASEPQSDVTVNLHNSGDKWNLVGNPFSTALNISDIASWTDGSTNLNSAVGQIWDDEDQSYVLTSDNNEKVAQWQGFFIENNDANTLTIPTSAKTTGTQFYKDTQQKGRMAFTLRGEYSGGDFQTTDKASVLYFHEQATHERDIFDATKLVPMASRYAVLGFSSSDANETGTGSNLRAQESRPFNFEGELSIGMQLQSYQMEGKFTLSWKSIDLPEDWKFTLIDNQSGAEIDMNAEKSYEFFYSSPEKDNSKISEQSKQVRALPSTVSVKSKELEQPRFTLKVSSPSNFEDSNSSEIPESVKLNPNYPNPFNPSTTISFELTEEAHVKLNVYTIVGQKVATLVDEVREVGEHQESWNASDMPSGIYIAQLEVQGKVYIRKMTLIK